jgi:uncharacterized protein (DUF2236 family)
VAPLGPDSITWKYFGDWRTLLLALWAGSMQNMHPQLGAGVEEHSRFFEERWQRLFRSLYPIGGVVYDGPRAERTAHEIRGYHNAIKGVDKKGRPYHALNPETFYWAHATFLMLPVLVAEYFGEPMSTADKEKYYAETVEWYALYGVSMRPVPPDWTSFERYFDRMCRDELEDNEATREVLDLADLARPPTLSWVPMPVWRLVRVPIARGFVWLTVGLYPPSIRALLGFGWSRRDEWLLRRFGRLVRFGWRFVPFDRRFHPRARAGWHRERSGVDAVVETPRRNLPPQDRWADPSHYVPADCRGQAG